MKTKSLNPSDDNETLTKVNSNYKWRMSSGKRAFVIEFKFNSSSRLVPRANDNFQLETFFIAA